MNWWFIISGVIIIPGLISLMFFGLKLGIDFTGGSLIELRFNQPVTIEQVKEVLVAHNLANSYIQPSENNTIIIRTKELKNQNEQVALLNDLNTKLGGYDETSKRVELVGPVIGKELMFNGIMALLIALAAIVAYISFRFQFDFAVSAIIALVHDLLVIIGAFSILGVLFHVEVDTLFITALLTIIGFSVHDTIVIFDRIRENNKLYSKHEKFEDIVNYSLWQTMARSINTSLTVVLTLLALLFLGGETIRYLVIALLIGIISGTFSSIFNASPILVLLRRFRTRREAEDKAKLEATKA
jgi:preprotein translocase SecF subunit